MRDGKGNKEEGGEIDERGDEKCSQCGRDGESRDDFHKRKWGGKEVVYRSHETQEIDTTGGRHNGVHDDSHGDHAGDHELSVGNPFNGSDTRSDRRSKDDKIKKGTEKR